MTERRDIDIATAERPDQAPGQSANRPLNTSDLAGTDRQTRTNELAGPRDSTMAPHATDEKSAPLFAPDRAKDFHQRWDTIQTGFVDEPRRAVEQADTLVAEVIQQLAKSFADERSKLEQQWRSGGNVSTEDLRLGLRRYRSFFDRLLSM
jgi:hypothetical protein